MAAPFDFAKLNPALYVLDDAASAMDFQIMVEEFMEAVKTTPEALEDHEQACKTFCEMLAEDPAWQLAANVVPEFRYSQDYNTDEDSLMNTILRTLKHKRPRAPYNDPTTAAEKEILRKRYRAAIDYLETCGRGVAQGSDQEVEAADNVYQNLIDTMEE
ncbi:hypothetical protein LTR99_009435 [Exophiala xenobiotica]|uniref:Uncharacterized protein n=1 Tax=Vermiconidia calcicola TaxID=1690605 RepID=A0AAV9PWZ2_9PEZI|nr:hypothetical protein LTR92_002263 [Exophiala xenobiotica]KAK5530889.1 hypothetical protein LTR25_008746 [Vermiconidia calcicola]KAK5544381.1 hypothetical protein LTR23_004469 [Chaetothyriales sp. CCFEE 6169]KAK5269006.1 hypothetical protein LTR96_005790 [Exophiala xenobiotica]KAK5294629.1 hypothetical protein LTR99_009435 [Exophiala xenobiotica]